MEPVKEQINRWKIYATVERVERKFIDKWKSGVATGTEKVVADFEQVYLGWYVSFYGSHESLYFGEEEPNIKKNDRVTITIEKR